METSPPPTGATSAPASTTTVRPDGPPPAGSTDDVVDPGPGREHGPVWALAPGRFAVIAAGFVVAAVATPFSGAQIVISGVGLVWVAATALLACVQRRAGRTRGRLPSPAVLAVDAVFVLAVVAVTGGAESPLRWLMIAAPAMLATSRQRHVAALGAVGALGYLVASAADLADPDAATLETVVGFLAIYTGVTLAGEASSRARQRETDLLLAVVEERKSVQARLLEQARQQRETLVLQLHDGPLQVALAARQDLEDATAEDPVDLGALREDLAEVVAGMRTLTAELYDEILGDDDLAASLELVAREAEARGGPPTNVAVGAGCAGSHDALVLRTVRELLSNVEKHARADAVCVTVSVVPGPERLRVVVSDDGIGLAAGRRKDALGEGHVGLASVERAVAAAGGELRVLAPLKGTEIRIDLPVAGADG